MTRQAIIRSKKDILKEQLYDAECKWIERERVKAGTEEKRERRMRGIRVVEENSNQKKTV